MFILIADKIEFKFKSLKEAKGHFIVMKDSIQWEDLTVVKFTT